MRTNLRGRAAAIVLAIVLAMTTVALGGSPAAAADWHPTPGSTPDADTYVYLSSQAGDYIGAGRSYTYVAADTDITVAATGGLISVNVDGDEGWRASFEPPSSVTTVVEGRYEGLTRYPFNADATGGLSWYGEGRGCNTLTGWYEVDDVAYTGGELSRLALRFEQHCEGKAAALRGEIHWLADDPDATFVPTPTQPIPEGFWRPAGGATPATGRYLFLASQAGDWVGKGDTYLYETPEELDYMSVTGGGSALALDYRDFDGEFDWWYLDAVASNRADSLVPGLYDDLQRHPFHNPVRGGFSFSGNGAGCNRLLADVAVDEIDLRGGDVQDVTMRFVQHCDGDTAALRGELRWQPDPSDGAPMEVTGVTAEPGDTEAEVSWEGTPGATGYAITVYREGTAVATVPVAGGALSHVVTGLENDVSYSFKVAGANAAGTGLRSRASAPVVPYVVVPIVSSVSPAFGPRTGGVEVAIYGDHLGDATEVRFGTTAAASFTVLSDNAITAVTPSLPAGNHTVTVTDPAGTSEGGPSYNARAIVSGPPSAVSATPAWARLAVTWTAPTQPGDHPRTQYLVRAVPTGAGGTVTTAAAGDATSATVYGLVPGRTYRATVVAVSDAGEGLPASSAEVTVPAPELGPFASVEALVARQYQDFLGRAPSGAETTAGATSIRNGTQPSQMFIFGMSHRAEWAARRAPVIRLYSAYFLRTPDTGGLTYWTDQLARGVSLAKVSQSFAASAEFKARYGNLGNAEFVRRVYLNVLGRQPDSAGLAYWKGRLDAGMTRGALMIGFSESGENKTLMAPTVDIVLLYAGMLRRVPTASELTDALAVLGAGGTPHDIALGLLTSSAYAARVG